MPDIEDFAIRHRCDARSPNRLTRSAQRGVEVSLTNEMMLWDNIRAQRRWETSLDVMKSCNKEVM